MNSSAKTVSAPLVEYYRCAADLPDLVIRGSLSGRRGFFCLDAKAICYGRCLSGSPAAGFKEDLYNASSDVIIDQSVHLPFDATEVLDNFRRERYRVWDYHAAIPYNSGSLSRLYYLARPLLGASVRRRLQQIYFRQWRDIPFPSWPVDRTVEEIFERLLVLTMRAAGVSRLPFVWFWPNGASSCAMMTHDVETAAGFEFCRELMDLNDSVGIKSAFQIIPERRYCVDASLLRTIWERGFEVNVHDLNHDGLLWSDRDEFLRRVRRINSYGREFGARGFRSAVMYRNPEWYEALDFSYDMSIPNVAHLDPQRGGCCTVMPYFIGGILELPLTTTQDYTLFHILRDYSIELWKQQISLIREKHGLISFIIHPDYIIDKRARQVYAKLLEVLVELRTQGQTWIALPGEIAAWWRLRDKLNLVNAGGKWRIEGDGSERARMAFAVLKNERLTYEVCV